MITPTCGELYLLYLTTSSVVLSLCDIHLATIRREGSKTRIRETLTRHDSKCELLANRDYRARDKRNEYYADYADPHLKI
ncbi:hypothetical protein BYT27DRAFT_6537377 [Phlegmacium glaucopus]|nr:hypothetical protein BYT27DRAFT_6537377 [Phlegmacium glaucopus]